MPTALAQPLSSDTPPAAADDVQAVAQLAEARRRMLAEIEKRVVGQREVIDQLLVGLFAGATAFSWEFPGWPRRCSSALWPSCWSSSFHGIQFTPDLMPSDITGTEILEEDRSTGRRAFRFVPGPLFANLVLADEINRTPPKTQAALLQAMAEQRVTAGGRTHLLTRPFLVFATQNPIEQEGTYPLPEAQLDRFMLLINVDYPSAEEELRLRQRVGAFLFDRILSGEDQERAREEMGAATGSDPLLGHGLEQRGLGFGGSAVGSRRPEPGWRRVARARTERRVGRCCGPPRGSRCP